MSVTDPSGSAAAAPCRTCGAAVPAGAETCDQCGTAVQGVVVPLRVGGRPDVTIPPPPVAADRRRRRRAAPVEGPASDLDSTGVIVKMFLVFGFSALVTATGVVLLGLALIPPPAPPIALPVAPAPIVPAVSLAPPVVGSIPVDVTAAPPVATPIEVAPAPSPTADRRPPTPAPNAVTPIPVEPAPGPTPVTVETAPPIEVVPRLTTTQPVPEPAPPSPGAALDGLYVGLSDGAPMSLELVFGAGGALRATSRVQTREGAAQQRLRGTYVLLPDGSAEIALGASDGATSVGYSGTVSGSHVSGIVTENGRRKGRFEADR
jgi:hypothetical protein